MRGCTATLTLAIALFAGTAHAATITFDEFAVAPDLSAPITNGYQGFNWTNFFANDAGPNSVGTGYLNGTVSEENTGINGFGSPASFSSAGTFTLNSFYMSAAWLDGLTVRVVGRLNGGTVFSTSLLVDRSGPNLFVFNWSGINEVYLETSGGTPVPGLFSQTTQVAIDNIRVNETAVPEPGTLLLLGSGLAAAAFRLRKART
jgi:PEP-CTERM motif